eukprot:GEMP01028153.1.p1 GENE.GEMP01028153.1~~GEMP01028153.1.p1  ORF type:complete len:167 (+),score=38.56 GEMP01028153.1:614-1114(+)
MSEAMALAENNGLCRERLMTMLNTSIFDCLIYRGYGSRIANRTHMQDGDHPGFSLELGRKDVHLIAQTAALSSTPMPFGSLLHDRYTAASNRGMGLLDWSSLGLLASIDAGIDVTEAIRNPQPEKVSGEKRGREGTCALTNPSGASEEHGDGCTGDIDGNEKKGNG